MDTNLLIIGSGPAGYTAAIYASRAGLSPILLTGSEKGGQLTTTTEIENYPGFPNPIQGPWLMEQMEKQSENVGVKIINDTAIDINLTNFPFLTKTSGGNNIQSNSLIIATGAQAKWLNIQSETKFRGRGVSACATCDGFFYKGKKVFVVGGGNTAMEEALYLCNHASEVVIIHRRNKFRGEKIMQERVFSNSKISVIWNSSIEEIIGDERDMFVAGVVLKNLETNELSKHIGDGVFIAIGHKPNTELFPDIEKDHDGYIKTVHGTTLTNIEGVFAAGDVQDKIYRQAVTAAGSGCMAALDAERYLSSKLYI